MLHHLKEKLVNVERHLQETRALRERLRAAIELFEDADERKAICGGSDERRKDRRRLSEAVENAPSADAAS